MISTLIYNAKFGDKLAMEQLLNKFHPLLKKYANKLKYEDALSELTLFFIELVHKIPMQMLQSANEGKLVKYIDTGVQNQYYYLLKKLIFISKEVNSSTISDEQMHFLESSLATTDEITSENIFYILKPYLSPRELHVIIQIYYLGYTAAEIARKENTTRQAVKQLKQRALLKIKNFLTDN